VKSKYAKPAIDTIAGGGGGAPRIATPQSSSPYKLAPAEPRNAKGLIEIWSKRAGTKVSEARTMKGARNAVDRRDNTYGGYDHYIKRKYD
jgi:hypothetical protein